jgi:hypothetical protein
MQILKETAMDWCERRLISKLQMDLALKHDWTKGETTSLKTGRRVRQGCYLSQILFKLYSEY